MGFFKDLWKEIVEIFYPSDAVKTVGIFISNAEVYQILAKKGITCSIITFDSTYAVVDEEWLEGTGYNYYSSLLDKLGVKGWRDDFDCDSFGLFFLSLAQVCHYNSRTNTESPAIGIVCYTPKGSDGSHLINMVITKDKGLRFFEPQTGRYKELEKCEFNSISYVLF